MEKKKQSGFRRFMSGYGIVILTGLLIGAAAVILSNLQKIFPNLADYQQNPGNMGFCIACFLRDIAGAAMLQTSGPQYFRPEIVGLILGAMIWAMIKKEWKPTGGSSPITRFCIGAGVMIGALVFLGCPLRMVIRIGGGDLNALVGLAGFIVGILVGIIPLHFGFSLNRAYKQSAVEGLILPVIFVLFFVVSITTKLFASSKSGPGSMHAFWLIALGIALVIGAFCQQSRLCMAGGIRDAVLFRDFRLISGFAAIIVAVLVGNLIANKSIAFSFEQQPVAHNDGLLNFLGMVIVGYGSVLLGGCPLRQLILTGEGNTDSGITVLGYIAGAAIVHNFDLSGAGTPDSHKRLYILLCIFAVFTLIAVFNTKRRKA